MQRTLASLGLAVIVAGTFYIYNNLNKTEKNKTETKVEAIKELKQDEKDSIENEESLKVETIKDIIQESVNYEYQNEPAIIANTYKRATNDGTSETKKRSFKKEENDTTEQEHEEPEKQQQPTDISKDISKEFTNLFVF